MNAFENCVDDTSDEKVTSAYEACELLLRFGVPAVFIDPGSMDVVVWNPLFADLVAGSGVSDPRRWFVDAVLRSMDSVERERWIDAREGLEAATAPVRFILENGERGDFEMRSAKMSDDRARRQFIGCIFVTVAGMASEKAHKSALEKGRAMERAYIRNQLHKNVSQKLLGAAFGCKILAGKIEGMNEVQAREASALAELLNEVVIDLQNLTRSA